MQTKTMVRDHFIQIPCIKWVKIKKSDNIKCWRDHKSSRFFKNFSDESVHWNDCFGKQFIIIM